MNFAILADYYDKLEGVSSRLKMIDIMAELFKASDNQEIANIVYITQGILAPPFEGKEFGVAEKMAIDSIALATGYSKLEVEMDFRKTGDLGKTAENFVSKSKLKRMQDSKSSVSYVYASMVKISEASGKGSKEQKIKLLANLIAASSPLESRYIIRYPLGQLRLGLGDATMLEALSIMEIGDRSLKEKLENAYNICSDLGFVAMELKAKGLESINKFSVSIFKPIRPALAERLPTGEEILKKMGGICAVEQKYDGFRCQIHKKGKQVEIYSRRLEKTTSMFPDMVKASQTEVNASEAIFEGEALAYNEVTGEFMPFQETIQRKRKHGIKEKAEDLPLRLMAFDVMMVDGKSLINEPYSERRKRLESMLQGSDIIRPSKRIITKSASELEEFFNSSVTDGLEGIVAKGLDSPYVAGARKFSWIKLKRSYRGEISDTIDVVVVGYYRGKGSRTEFGFGGLLCAVYNEKRDMFETVSKLGTGFTEDQMRELSAKLGAIKQKTRPVRVDAVVEPDFWVYPKYVVTVMADEITRSPSHTCGISVQEDGTKSGYSLRFPRLVGETTIREDKSPEEATTTQEIMEMFSQQKKVRVSEKG